VRWPGAGDEEGAAIRPDGEAGHSMGVLDRRPYPIHQPSFVPAISDHF
jgi:hypothetical protein